MERYQIVSRAMAAQALRARFPGWCVQYTDGHIVSSAWGVWGTSHGSHPSRCAALIEMVAVEIYAAADPQVLWFDALAEAERRCATDEIETAVQRIERLGLMGGV